MQNVLRLIVSVEDQLDSEDPPGLSWAMAQLGGDASVVKTSSI